MEREGTQIQRRPSLVVNALSNYVSLGANVIVGYLLTPYVIFCLGKTGYGIWSLIGSFVGYYGLINLGVGPAIVRYVARYSGKNDYKSLNETISSALALFLVTGSVVITASFVLAGPMAQFFKIEPAHVNQFELVFRIMGFTTALSFIEYLFRAVIFAHERYVVANFINVASTLVRAFLTFYLLWMGLDLSSLAWAMLASTITGICLNLCSFRFLPSPVEVRFTMVHPKVVKTLLNFGFFTMLIAVGDTLRFQISSAVIGYNINMENVGVYSVAVTIFNYVANLTVSASGVLRPRLANLAGAENEKEFRHQLLFYSRILAAFSFYIGLAFIMLGRDFIVLWVGPGFAESGIILMILLCGFIPDAATGAYFSGLLAIKKHHYYAYQTIVEGMANLILSVILVKRFGLYGVALGTMIPLLITKLFIQPIYCTRIFRISYFRYMYDCIVVPTFIAVLVGFGLHYMVFSVQAQSYGALTARGLIISACFAFFAYWCCFQAGERERFTKRVCAVFRPMIGGTAAAEER